jgi:hypothetical protein
VNTCALGVPDTSTTKILDVDAEGRPIAWSQWSRLCGEPAFEEFLGQSYCPEHLPLVVESRGKWPVAE